MAGKEVDNLNNSLTTFVALTNEELLDAHEKFSAQNYDEVAVSISGISGQISNLERQIEGLEDNEAQIHRQKIARLQEEKHMLEEVAAIKRSEEGLDLMKRADEDAIKRLFVLQDILEEVDKQGPIGRRLYSPKMALMGTHARKQSSTDILKGIGLNQEEVDAFFDNLKTDGKQNWAVLAQDMEPETRKLFEDMTKAGIDNWDELEEYYLNSSILPNLNEEISSQAESGAESIDILTDSLYKFGNAREELFYGFASGNVTGDMIKQVTQKGVDTLLNSTEVIMNNKFMGMTTEEAANSIVAQIESRLAVKDINLSIA